MLIWILLALAIFWTVIGGVVGIMAFSDDDFPNHNSILKSIALFILFGPVCWAGAVVLLMIYPIYLLYEWLID